MLIDDISEYYSMFDKLPCAETKSRQTRGSRAGQLTVLRVLPVGKGENASQTVRLNFTGTRKPAV